MNLIRRDAGIVRVAVTVALMTAALIVLGPRLKDALIALLFSVIIAYLIAPLMRFFEKKVSAKAAPLLAFVSVVLILVFLIGVVLFPALSELSQLPGYIAAAVRQVEPILEGEQRLLSQFGLGNDTFGILPKASDAASVISNTASFLLSGAASVVSVVSQMMVILALSFFILSDWETISVRLSLLIPSFIRPGALRAASGIRRELGAYLRAQAMIVLSVSAMAIAALYVLGSPIPLAMGLMYGLMNAIPYFGPLIGVIPPVFSALSGGWQQALVTLGALLLIQQIDNYVLSPRVVGSFSGASPAMVLFAISAGAALGSIMGMFLALPLLVSAKAAYRAFTQAKEMKTDM